MAADRRYVTWGVGLAGAALLTGCAGQAVAPAPDAAPQAAGGTTAASASTGAAPAAATGAPKPMARPAAPAATGSAAAASTEDLGRPFATRYARFEPVAFSALPGWTVDSMRESLEAFKQSCMALGKKPVWSDLCRGAGGLDGRSDAATRGFFEKNFHAYSVLNPDQTDEGVITGYYEPLLEGSRTRSPRYPYPVLGTPADLLFMDARTVEGGARQWLRIAERRLVPAATNAPGARLYDIAMGDVTPGIRDKRFRVRVEGGRVMPYWSRQEIEQRKVDAQVLAWVNDPYALYSMQIQGSGKIRMPDGRLLRVAFAEQNGRPFLPQASSGDAVAAGSAIKTRGLNVGGASVAAMTAARPAAPASASAAGGRDPQVAQLIAALQGNGSARPAAVPAAPAVQPAPAPARPASSSSRDPSVAAMIAALGGKPGASSSAPARADPAPAAAPAAPAPAPSVAQARDPSVAALIAALGGRPAPAGSAPAPAAAGDASPAAPAAAPDAETAAAGAGTVTGIPDPSYVFFRLIPDGPQGPLGALGVPLTAGRSIAVDPRTTPLGYPVFVSTGDAGAGTGAAAPVNRLMFAQDTGGAIRGSVRADYFWGFGPDAGSRAATMKATGRMWLLLPRELPASAETAALRTRSIGGPAGPLPECVVADPDNCVEE